jgi:hypothetical protein
MINEINISRNADHLESQQQMQLSRGNMMIENDYKRHDFLRLSMHRGMQNADHGNHPSIEIVNSDHA